MDDCLQAKQRRKCKTSHELNHKLIHCTQTLAQPITSYVLCSVTHFVTFEHDLNSQHMQALVVVVVHRLTEVY